MKIHALIHAPHEELGNIYKWSKSKGYTISKTHLYQNEELPKDLSQIDLLVIMGGPMGVHDERDFPWLVKEKKFIERAMDLPLKKILGICLGAQLLASVLGAEVKKNKVREIGWFTVNLTDEGKQNPIFNEIPEKFDAFHWHEDTFSIPKGAKHLAYSEFCENQAFSYNNIIALQFHPEVNRDLISGFISDPGMDLIVSPSTQSPELMVRDTQNFLKLEEIFDKFMDNLLSDY